MKKIKLTQGKFALVSNVDFAYLNQWKWYAKKRQKTFYAVRNIESWPNQKHIRMHRVILQRMGYKKFSETDHKDGNGLNNQRSNLRFATTRQNQCNKRKRKDNTSGYVGVYWDKRSEKWGSQITVNHQHIHLGYFTSKQQAADVYNKAAKKYFGNFARLNKI